MISSDVIIHDQNDILEDFKNGLDVSIKRFMELPFLEVKDTPLWEEKFTSTEGGTSTKWVGELEEAPDFKLEEGYSMVVEPAEFANSITVSRKLRLKARDNRLMIQDFLVEERNQMLNDVDQFLIDYIYDFLNTAFTTTNNVAPDGVALCGTHVYNSTGNTFTNFDTQALSQGALDTLMTYGGTSRVADGKQRPISFDTLVVSEGSEAERWCKRNIIMDFTPNTIGAINIYKGTYKVIVIPYIDDARKWFAFDSRKRSPLRVHFNQRPTFAPAQVMKNLSIYTPVYGAVKKAIVNLPKYFYGSNGTT